MEEGGMELHFEKGNWESLEDCYEKKLKRVSNSTVSPLPKMSFAYYAHFQTPYL